MSSRPDDELERLASRLAMLAADENEAANAGRAVAVLARKLGMTGGDLKEIFLAGAAVAGRARSAAGNEAEERLARENSALRHSLSLAEVAGRNAERERDALRAENSALQAAFDAKRSADQVRLIVGGTILAAVVAGAAYMFIGPAFRPPPGGTKPDPADISAPFSRAGLVRAGGASLYVEADKGAAIVSVLPAGTHVLVKRLFWRTLMQWAEVQVGGQAGYVVVTDLDLS